LSRARIGLRGIVLALALVTLAACVRSPVLDEVKRDLAAGDAAAALARLDEAVRADPDNRELRAYYLRQRDLLVARETAAAQQALALGQYAQARAAFEAALRFDPENARALAGLRDLDAARRRAQRLAEAESLAARGDARKAEDIARAVLAEDPGHTAAGQLLRKLEEQALERRPATDALQSALSRPVTLEFRDSPLRTVFEVLARTARVNFVFDKDVRQETKVTLFVRDAMMEDVIRLVLATNQLERKVLNDNSVLIYPNLPAKQKEYQELVTRTFYLTHLEAKQAQALVKQLAKTRDLYVEDKLNALVVKDTPEAVRYVERLIASLDLAEPEVVLDVEVMEVSRTKLLELGIRYPDSIGYGLLTPSTTTTTIVPGGTAQTSTTLGGTLAPGFINLEETGALVPFISNPALVLNLKDQDGSSNVLANPRIRVKNREKARVHIGEKLPVFTTTSTANVGVSASVSYLDVGLKLDVEPTIALDNAVSIRITLEVSAVVREVPGPSGSVAYQVGTRAANTVLRLRDGETQVLAGLISDEERSSANRLPGLGEIPVLGRLFSNQRDNGTQTEIVLLITPRIVRNLVRPEVASAAFASGTEANVGAAPMVAGKVAPGALSLSGPAAGAAAPQGGARTAPPRPSPAGSGDGPVGLPQAAGEPDAAQAEQPATPESADNGRQRPGEQSAVRQPEAAQAPGEQSGGQQPAAEPQAAQQTAAPTVTVRGPARARPGSTFTVNVVVSGAGGAVAGEIVLGYDGAMLEAVGPGSATGGALRLPIRGATTVATFRASGNALGQAQLTPQSIELSVGGKPVDVALPDGFSVNISQ
jgi:general secretion pathway protein D